MPMSTTQQMQDKSNPTLKCCGSNDSKSAIVQKFIASQLIEVNMKNSDCLHG